MANVVVASEIKVAEAVEPMVAEEQQGGGADAEYHQVTWSELTQNQQILASILLCLGCLLYIYPIIATIVAVTSCGGQAGTVVLGLMLSTIFTAILIAFGISGCRHSSFRVFIISLFTNAVLSVTLLVANFNSFIFDGCAVAENGLLLAQAIMGIIFLLVACTAGREFNEIVGNGHGGSLCEDLFHRTDYPPGADGTYPRVRIRL